MSEAGVCPLCQSHCDVFCEDKTRSYWACRVCNLVHVPTRYHLDPAAEKAEYDKHENEVGNLGYRRFLSRLADPLLTMLPRASHGLDFGCGPAPALADMLRGAGHEVALYDLFYRNDAQVLIQQYDFICATEVVEHLAAPSQVLEQLWACVVAGGLLGLMTKRVSGAEAFNQWHYKNDPTHISFFHETTFQFLAKRWRAEVVFPADDVVIFKKYSG